MPENGIISGPWNSPLLGEYPINRTRRVVGATSWKCDDRRLCNHEGMPSHHAGAGRIAFLNKGVTGYAVSANEPLGIADGIDSCYHAERITCSGLCDNLTEFGTCGTSVPVPTTSAR
jgi:hypothetical protein